MTIYKKRTQSHIYRKIYEQHYGPIPVDEDGRTYDIHHIDGDHSNNNPDNLKAVTIQEHYAIHYKQGNFGSCQKIALRMKVSSQELSNLARDLALDRVANGTHNWQNSEIATEKNLKRIKEKTHHFIGETNPVYKQLLDNKHPFTGGDIQRQLANKLISEGTHHFLDSDAARKRAKDRIERGTHNLVGEASPHNIKVSCIFCRKIVGKPVFAKYHGDKCEKKP